MVSKEIVHECPVTESSGLLVLAFDTSTLNKAGRWLTGLFTCIFEAFESKDSDLKSHDFNVQLHPFSLFKKWGGKGTQISNNLNSKRNDNQKTSLDYSLIFKEMKKDRINFFGLELFHKLQIKKHNWLDYLLVLRDYPAVVLLEGKALIRFLKQTANSEKKGKTQLDWLVQDAYITFVTDSAGLDWVSQNERWQKLKVVSWEESNQDTQIIEPFLDHFITPTIRGFGYKSQGIRKKIVAYSKRPSNVSQSRKHVMILGPSRSGKEMVAEALHNAAELPKDELEFIRCGMVSPHLVQDQLFGHWQGAFTGASSDVPGVFERRSNGTVVIDDIDAAQEPLAVQSALLGILAKTPYQVTRLGDPSKNSSKQVKTTVKTWVMVTINKNLRKMIANGTMREDFLFRFLQFIQVPGFDKRREDIPFIAQSLLVNKLCIDWPLNISALQMLRDLDRNWAGNANELMALLLCASEIHSENQYLSWQQALKRILAISDDYLDWYSQEETKQPASEKTISPNLQWWELIETTNSTREKTLREQYEVNLLEALKELMNDKGYTRILQVKNQRDQLNEKNPAQIPILRLLLYLILCEKDVNCEDSILRIFQRRARASGKQVKINFRKREDEIFTQRIIKEILNINRETVKKSATVLFNNELISIEKKMHGKSPFLYKIDKTFV